MNQQNLSVRLEQARRVTMSLFYDVVRQEESLHQRPMGFRPILWHLGHMGAFEAFWLLHKMGQEVPVSNEYMEIFDPIKTPREASQGLPSLNTLTQLVTQIRELVLEFLDHRSFDTEEPLLRNGYVYEMVLQHELQHQETVCYLLHLLDPKSKRAPANWSTPPPAHSRMRYSLSDMVFISGGELELGATDVGGFVYDNELPVHRVAFKPFEIDRAPVTNAAFREFIEAGGYNDPRLWDVEGWTWRTEKEIQHPVYWVREEHQWLARSMFDVAPLEPDTPVYGVSWYEASAFARWVGKRLPTEAEWVAAAYYDWQRERVQRFAWGETDPDATRANFGNHFWKATPVGSFPQGRNPAGCWEMAGNVWEWTATVFDGYPGFEAFPYSEYSQLWFDGDHRVLKGGSWATYQPIMRSSFRNFFRRNFQFAFAGFRCCRDRQ